MSTSVTILKKDGIWGYQVYDGQCVHPFRTLENPDGSVRFYRIVVTEVQRLVRTGFKAKIYYDTKKGDV